MQVRVLGPLEVVCGDTIVRLAGRQQARVLTALALAPGSVVSNDRLMAALWGDALPRSALPSLRAHVSRLRAALHDDDGAIIATWAKGYQLLVERDAIDASRFEQLAAEGRRVCHAEPARAVAALDDALALWRGPAHADFADEPFVRPAAVRLEELRRTAIEDRFDALLAAGRHVEVTAELEAFAQRYPLRERFHRQLMLALYRTGRQAEALAVFRAFRTLLARELGLQPSAALRALEHDILRQDASLELAAPYDEPVPPVSRTPAHAGVPPAHRPPAASGQVGARAPAGARRPTRGARRVAAVGASIPPREARDRARRGGHRQDRARASVL